MKFKNLKKLVIGKSYKKVKEIIDWKEYEFGSINIKTLLQIHNPLNNFWNEISNNSPSSLVINMKRDNNIPVSSFSITRIYTTILWGNYTFM